ncbi:MAG: PKD domain-containing protein, partial [Candidatus Bipolaricaulaceae bacterium]
MRKANWHLPAVLALVGLFLGGCAWLLPPLTAKLAAHPTSGHVPLSVTFSAAGSTGPITAFTLDFGDGSSPYSGTDITVNISHTYNAHGTYKAVLTVQDAQGRTAT